MTATDCDANASFSSIRSMSPIVEAGPLQRLADGADGADAHHLGLAAGDREAAHDRERLEAVRARRTTRS